MYSYTQGKDIIISETSRSVNRYTWYPNGVMWEKESIEEFYRHVPTDQPVVIVDIGAQSGLYTLYAKFLPLATFYAFEPYKPSYDCLLENIKLNGIKNVKTFNMAISDTISKAILNVCVDQNGLNTFGNPKRFDIFRSDRVEVETTTLDEFFKDIHIDFIKCDTEGWELKILEGGINKLKTDKPVLQLEYNITNMAQCNVTPKDLDDFLLEFKYTCVSTVSEEKIYK